VEVWKLLEEFPDDAANQGEIAMTRPLLAILICLLAGCGKPDGPEMGSGNCLSGLVAHRAEIDASFATDEYPLGEVQKAAFSGLYYYPPNAEFCFPARFEAAVPGNTFNMPTYNEKSLPFREYGTFIFDANGVRYSLTAYQRMDLPEEERQWALVPFKDATNGRGTYGGGRYLEIKFPIEATTEIDFNRASNPWCAYDPKYTCPVPPVENWLKLPVEAGEKEFSTNSADSH
jgi:uncharacterized protein